MSKGSLKFLFDENISPAMKRILHALGDKWIKSLREYDGQGRPDEEWLPKAIQQGFVCLTCDRKMLIQHSTALIFSQANARVIFIGNHFANGKIWDQAIWLLKYWRKLRQRAELMQPGDLLKVLKNDRIVEAKPQVY